MKLKAVLRYLDRNLSRESKSRGARHRVVLHDLMEDTCQFDLVLEVEPYDMLGRRVVGAIFSFKHEGPIIKVVLDRCSPESVYKKGLPEIEEKLNRKCRRGAKK